MSISKGITTAIINFLFFINTLFAQPNQLSAEQQDRMIIVRIDNETFTCYRYGEGQKYPYFYPLVGPKSGISVTTESSLPYPHHRSLWFACDRVNGGNYWQEGNERGQIISKGAEIIENNPESIRIEDNCIWKKPEEDPIISDKRIITITSPSDDKRIIDFKILLIALTDIIVLKTNHSLFSVRMHPSLSVNNGGTLQNAEGLIGEKETAGVNSPWIDYFGSRFGITEGIAIFDSPKNIWFPSRWFTRDYGFFSPTNLNWLSEDAKFNKGELVEFEYRVVIHSGNTEEADINGEFNYWIESKK